MEVSPRRRELPSEEDLKRLHAAAALRRAADGELRAAVRAARASGGSVRTIAEEAGLSTRTVQDWLRN